MSSAVEFVKNEILGFFQERKAEAGHALHVPAFFHQRMIHWNPKQKEGLDQAIQELTSESLIEFKNETIFLSERGVDMLYPPVGNSVKDDILGYFADSRADAGHVLHPQAFYHQRMTHWNPKQKKAFDAAVAELTTSGLVEEKSGSIALTKKGVDAIY